MSKALEGSRKTLIVVSRWSIAEEIVLSIVFDSVEGLPQINKDYTIMKTSVNIDTLLSFVSNEAVRVLCS